MTKGRPKLSSSPVKQKLITEAKELFKKRGYLRVSIESLCDKASVSKMSFYRHFKNKEAIALHIAQLHYKNEIEWSKKFMEQEIEFEERLNQLLQRRKNNLKGIGNRFIEEFFSSGGEDVKKFLDFISKEVTKVNLDFLNYGKKIGKISEKITGKMFLFFLKRRNEMMIDPELKKICPNPNERFAAIDDFFYYGLSGRVK